MIGGLAGAVPPLLGWAAVTGMQREWDWAHALLLVLIIFVWTPPHFWALAIFRREDYSRALVPMLPVTHGVDLHALADPALHGAAGGGDGAALGHPHERACSTSAARWCWARCSCGTRGGCWTRRTSSSRCACSSYSIVYLMALFAFLLVDHWLMPLFEAAPALEFAPAP